MTTEAPDSTRPVVLDLDGLQALLDALADLGYQLIGPTVRGGAVVPAPIRSVADLPGGVGDVQAPGSYRLSSGGRELFGFATAALSWKPFLFPPDRLLWRAPAPRAEGADGAPGAAPVLPAPADEPAPRQALIGVRSCDLHAIEVQDRVFLQRAAVDPDYAARRESCFIVAVGCAHPGSTCFCSSMGTGPVVDSGFDVSMVELVGAGEHTFVASAGSPRGAELLGALAGRPARDADLEAADRVGAAAAAAMGAGVDTTDLRELLYANAHHPRWTDVASRCLSCTSCTMVCPTCFCATAVDTSDLGADLERHSVWDSCFSDGHSALGGRPVRATTTDRYRQWLTHKFASWVDQFGTSGCVGCGRCVTWCPAGIDVREELAAIRATPGLRDGDGKEAGR